MTRLTRRNTETDPIGDVVPLLTEFGGHREMLSSLKQRSDELRDRMMVILERHGRPDDKGSLWLEFPSPIAGFGAIKRERRAKVMLDENSAEQVLREAKVYEDCVDVQITIDADQMDTVLAALKAAGIYDQVVTVKEILNDDKIMQLYFAEKDKDFPAIDARDIDAMFKEQVSWAFVPQGER